VLTRCRFLRAVFNNTSGGIIRSEWWLALVPELLRRELRDLFYFENCGVVCKCPKQSQARHRRHRAHDRPRMIVQNCPNA
jgi:hypothetical protein